MAPTRSRWRWSGPMAIVSRSRLAGHNRHTVPDPSYVWLRDRRNASTRDRLCVPVARVIDDPAVPGDDRHAEMTSRGHDQAVAGVPRQYAWEKGRVDRDLGRQGSLPDARTCHYPGEPSFRIGHKKHCGVAPSLRSAQKTDLPRRNGGDKHAVRQSRMDNRDSRRARHRVAIGEPDHGASVEQHGRRQRAAAH